MVPRRTAEVEGADMDMNKSGGGSVLSEPYRVKQWSNMGMNVHECVFANVDRYVYEYIRICIHTLCGSILGPLIFNIFLNDLFYFVKEGNMYNYADDNSISVIHKELTNLSRQLITNWGRGHGSVVLR